VANADLELWEHHIESEVDRDISIPLPKERRSSPLGEAKVSSSSG
jgi:hypothetical protein